MSQTKGTELHEEKERPKRIRVETFSHWEFIFCRYGLYQLDRVVEGGRGCCNTYTPCKDKQLELDVLTALLYDPFPAESKSTVMNGWNREKLVGDVLIVED